MSEEREEIIPELEGEEVGHSDGGGVSKEERNWAMTAHLAGFLGYLIPFGNVLGPFLVWMTKKEEMPFVERQAREALNFQISMVIYVIISFLLIFVVIGVLMLVALVIFNIVMMVMATLAVNKGEEFRYPLCIRLVK